VAHGHLTSSNVLLTIDGRVKVTDFRLAQAAFPSGALTDPAGDLAGLGRCLAAMLTGREPAPGTPIWLGPQVPAELAAVVNRTTGDPQSSYGSAADLVHDLNRFLADVRPGIAHTAQTAPATHHNPLGLAAPPSRSPGQLVPVAAAGPARRVAAAVGPPLARRRRALTLTVGLVVACLGATAGLLGRQSPGPLANQALTPASSAFLTTTTSQPTTSRASATTASPTTATADASPATSPQTTTGQLVVPGQRVVPDVVGLHRQEVTEVLARAQLGVQLISIQVSDSRQVQRVIGQRPPAGQVLPAGSAVTVLIGSRRPT
jgi:hypothetical protein